MVKERRHLLKIIRTRKKRWIGHLLRHDSLLRDVIEGRMEGKRPRGRKRMMLLEDIKDGGRSYYKTKRQAKERELWRGT